MRVTFLPLRQASVFIVKSLKCFTGYSLGTPTASFLWSLFWPCRQRLAKYKGKINKMVISNAFLLTPSNHGCVNSSTTYVLLGKRTSTIAGTYYLRWGGGPALAAGASHQMLCFLYSGEPFPPRSSFWHFCTFFLFFHVFAWMASFSKFCFSPW